MTTYQYIPATGKDLLLPGANRVSGLGTRVYNDPVKEYEDFVGAAGLKKFVDGMYNISAGTPLATSATITFETPVAAISAVQRGVGGGAAGVYSVQVTNLTPGTAQSLSLTGLTTANTYQYRVGQSTDGGVTWKWSGNKSFTTA